MPKDKKGGKKPAKPADSDSEEEPPKVAAPESDDDAPPAKSAPRKSAFALLDSDDDDDEDEEEQEKKPPPKKEEDKKKKKDAEPDDDDALKSMFGDKKKEKKEKKEDKDKKDKKEKKEKKEKKKPMPVICEVVEVSAIPKKDKLKLCKVRWNAAEDPIDVVTNAANIVAGKKFIIALPGVTTANGIEVKQAKVGGVDSTGMFCGPKEMGWDTDVLPEDQAVMAADDAEPFSPAPTYEAALALFKERKEAEEKAQAKAAPASDPKGKKGKKKGGKDKDDGEDLDELLGEFGVEIKDDPAAKGKKGKKGKADKEDDANAEAEFQPPPREEEPAAAAPAAKAAGKKDKKKGGKAAPADDDDLDAILAEEGMAPAPAQEAAPVAKEEEKEEKEVDAKTLANRRKKEKKKAKMGGGGLFGDDKDKDGDKEGEKKEEDKDADKEDGSPTAADSKKAGAKGKAKAKAESAVVKRAREEMERKRQLEEERAAFEAEQKRIIEEEERKYREEQEREEAERARKRDARKAKIDKMKADGTYMTKKEKEFAKRAALLREQFGFTNNDDDEEGGEAEEKPQPKKRSIAVENKKKKRPQQRDESGEPVSPKEDAKVEPKVEEKPKAEEKPKKAEKPKKVEEEGPDWEEVAEKLEEEAAKEEEEGEGESGDEDEGSDSDSDSDSGSSSSSGSSFAGYRSPILVIMGHVDTGKTKLLDKIRRTNVQDNEAGGITQQIGATFFPDIALIEQTKKVDPDFDIEVPGVMIIDTPGHEAFNNLRVRGSSLCDMAILVIDIMHGLEPQTVESLELLKQRQCFFIVALNKVDCLYQWKDKPNTSIQEALARQEQFVRDEFNKRLGDIKLQLNMRGLNCELYWENEDPRACVSIVPTSALTGEGVPDLLFMALKSTQEVMPDKLEVEEELSCTVIEVKNIEGLGTTIDVILVNGTLKEGDQIVLAGMGGPIVTTIRALLTPAPMKELRVKNEYIHHQKISTSMGIKICAPGLEDAVAGSELLVCGPDDDLEDLKDEVSDFESVLNGFDKQPAGVYVKASTLGSLEALLSFLTDMKIPVFDVGIGEVHVKDVKKASIMKDKKHPEYAVIMAFDVKVNNEAKKQAEKDDVQIMTADIIYHLFDKFTKYMEQVNEQKKEKKSTEAIFPCILQMNKEHIFRQKDPILVGCTIMGGQLRVGTPLCIPEKENMVIGRVGGIEKDKKPVKSARRGEQVCVKIEQNTAQTHITYGRHFDYKNTLYSLISRESIDTLKENFKSEMHKEDWELVIGLKQVFKIS